MSIDLEKEIKGCKVDALGDMEYVLVASPEFAKKHFAEGTPKECLRKAPAVKFDQNDQLHERYLEKFFHLNGKELNYNVIPSVRGFKELVLLGYGYALIPRIDIVSELKKKQLVQLYDKVWKVPLYWHHWAVDSEFYRKFNADIVRHVKSKLLRRG